MPKLAAASPTKNYNFFYGQHKIYASPHEIIEYAGMFALSCNLEPIEYLNTCSFSRHTIDIVNALCVRFSGIFSHNLIKMLF